MAVVRYRLNQKNDDDTYSVVHLETEASLVLMPDGTTAQDKLTNAGNFTGSIHADTHAIGGTDPLTADAIGAAKASDVDPLLDKLTELQGQLNDAINKVFTTIPSVPFAKNSLTYTGAEQSPEWNGFDETCMELSGDTAGTNAGEYTATFTAKKGYQWSDGSVEKSVKWTIERATITSVPSQSGSLTYTGSTQTPSWSNYSSTKLTISGSTTGTNAGSYTVTFTPKSNYKWSDNTTSGKSVTWRIGKASGSISLSATAVDFTSAGGSKQITVTRSGNGTISATSNNGNVASCSVSGNVVTVTNGATNGSCTITVDVAAGTNHSAVSKGIAVTRDVFTVPTTLGSTVSWAGYSWIVVHVESTKVYLALDHIHEKCQFGSNATYSGSNLASRAKTFENSLPSADLTNAVNTTVEGVTAKVFVATYAQMNGGFSYFSSNEKRICKYNGSAAWYWTSSPSGGSYIWRIYTDGSIVSNNSLPTANSGFRPFVALKR